MPRVSPMYRFMMMFHSEMEMNCIEIPREVAYVEAMRIWNTMTSNDKALLKKRICHYEVGELPETFEDFRKVREYPVSRIRLSVDNALKSMLELVRRSLENPIIFFSVRESQNTLGYPDELSLVKYSIKNGPEHILHAVLHDEAFGADYFKVIQKNSKWMFEAPIRDHKDAFNNKNELYRNIASFAQGKPLISTRSQIGTAHAVLQVLSLSDPVLKEPVPKLLRAEDFLLSILTEAAFFDASVNYEDFNGRLSKPDKTAHHHLACDLHEALGRQEACSMLDVLLLAENFVDIFSSYFKFDKFASKLGSRPSDRIEHFMSAARFRKVKKSLSGTAKRAAIGGQSLS